MKVRLIRVISAATLILALAQGAAAQAPSARTIRGVVYDSLDALPLSGAHVVLVSRRDPSRPAAGATTDSLGQYEISGVGPGAYVLGFEHPLLDSLDIKASPRKLELAATGLNPVVVDLGIPGGRRVRDAFCPVRWGADSSGAFVGHLEDASTRGFVSGGMVQASWLGVLRGARRLFLDPGNASARSGDDGWFVLCYLPGGIPVNVRAISGADTSNIVTVVVPILGVVRHDIYVTPASAPHAGRITGVVSSEDGSAVKRATVVVDATGTTVTTDGHGRFSLDSLPYGTLSLTVSRTGFAPRDVPVDVIVGAPTVVHVALSNAAGALDAAIALMAHSIDSANGLYARRVQYELSSGHKHAVSFDYADLRRLGARSLSDLLVRFGGYDIMNTDVGQSFTRRDEHRACAPDVYVNGQFIAGIRSPEALDNVGPIGTIAGVEFASPPGQVYDNDPTRCGPVSVWLLRTAAAGGG